MHAPLATTIERDLRLDLFRGIALWLIFLDHIPSNVVSWITIRNYGFSDATEIFIFISGYTAALVYGRQMRERGFLIAGAHVLRRAWQIYVAHIFLFAIFMAEISYVTTSFSNPLYAEEMNILDFLNHPDQTIIQALLLKFKPVNMDVLPLYIVLLLMFPPVLWSLRRWPTWTLVGSTALYVAANRFGWNMPSYPSGGWYFNPFAWQLLFVFGAWCAAGGAERLGYVLRTPVVTGLAIAYLVFAFLIAITWLLPQQLGLVPVWLEKLIYPIDKTNLDVLRFAHFLALAILTVRLVPFGTRIVRWEALQPAILCGQHSLEIFCLGVFLSFAGHFAMVQISATIWMQCLVSALGILIMIAMASLIAWYKRALGRSPVSRPKLANADLAGEQA